MTRRIFRHACPVAAAPAPDGDALLELFAGDAEQFQVLLGIFEMPSLSGTLGAGLTGKAKESVSAIARLLPPRDLAHEASPKSGLASCAAPTISLYLHFFSPQAVT